MALDFFWRCEGTTLDATHDFSAGDTTAAATGSPQISGTAARVGSNGILINSIGEYYAFDNASLISGAEGAVGLWFRPTTWTADSIIWNVTAAIGDEIRVAQSGTDEILFRIEQSGVGVVDLVTTAANLTVNNWYFVVVRWHNANNDRRIEVYNSSLALIHAIEDLTTAWSVGTFDEPIRFGEFGAAASTYHLDNIFIGDSYDEPFFNWALITSFTEYGKTPIPAGHSKFDPALVTNDDHFQAEMTALKHWF